MESTATSPLTATATGCARLTGWTGSGASARSRDKGAAIELCVLASGSSGNAIYVRGGNTAVLVDAGLTAKELRARMAVAGYGPASINAVLLTHAHIDHVKGADTVSRRLDIPVCANRSTADETFHRHGILLAALEPFVTNERFRVGGLEVLPFGVLHDTEDPVGFIVSDGAHRVAITTDLGRVTPLVERSLSGCDIVVLESNHDTGMLWNGSYPGHLKQRIAGEFGHLSNDEAASLVCSVYHPGLRHVVLAHVSDDNNLPGLPVETVSAALGERAGSVTLSRGWKREVAGVIEL